MQCHARQSCCARMIGAIAVGVFISLLSGCDRSDASDFQPTYAPGPATRPALGEVTFGIFPLRDAVRIVSQYQPLIDEINRNAKTAGRPSWRLELSRDYADFIFKLRNDRLSAALVNPGMALHFDGAGYRICVKESDDDRFRGILLTRKDSGIRTVADLRGLRISFPSVVSVAATMMNKMYLYDHGLNVDRDMSVLFTGSQDSAILNVFEGVADVGGTWPTSWDRMCKDRPDVSSKLQVSWQTPALNNLAIIVSSSLAPQDQKLLCDTLLQLNNTERGRSVLQEIDAPGYLPADAAAYEPTRKFLERYEAVFGKLPW